MKMSKQRLAELERAESKLHALERGGVENWDWYDDSLKEWNAENELEEKRDDLITQIAEEFGQCAYEPSERGAGIAFDDAHEKVMTILIEMGVYFKEKDNE